MSFKGLFIGIDRYASPGINWLGCARRDAVALHGLFTDSMGGETALLTDERATLAAIQEEFRKLETAAPEDVVVIAFSGHGSETHEIVTHDTDPYNIDETSIPLTVLGEWCSRVPCRRLLVILDCCFSGGLGAKALQVDTRARSLDSVDAELNRISGEGRVVLTASGPTQRAWESSRFGHGFLTLYLIEALKGPSEICQGDRIGLLRLLDYVSRRVADAASQIIARQCRASRSGDRDSERRRRIAGLPPQFGELAGERSALACLAIASASKRTLRDSRSKKQVI